MRADGLDDIDPAKRVQVICEALGLSRLIGQGLVQRALDAAGVFKVDEDGLAKAMPTLEARLRPFLPDAQSAAQGFGRLRKLAGIQ